LSCETNSKKAGVAGMLSGLSVIQQKAGHVTGAITQAMTRNIGQAAAKTLSVAESFDGPGSLDSLGIAVVGLEAGAWLWSRKSPVLGENVSSPETSPGGDIPGWWTRGIEKRRAARAIQSGKRFFSRAQQAESSARRIRYQALVAVGALKLSNTASIFAGTGLARLTRLEKAEQKFFFPNTTKVPVGRWPSRLTPALNRLDRGLAAVRESEGVMLEIKGQTWHRGTMVVKTAQGERTVTHIQSMSLPQQHYYSNSRFGKIKKRRFRPGKERGI
jgi:hypothetical protein